MCGIVGLSHRNLLDTSDSRGAESAHLLRSTPHDEASGPRNVNDTQRKLDRRHSLHSGHAGAIGTSNLSFRRINQRMHATKSLSKSAMKGRGKQMGKRITQIQRCSAICTLGMVLALTITVLAQSGAAQSVLNNDSIIKMATAGLGDDVIISMIKSQPGNFTVDADAVIQLKKAGLSEKVIGAMIEKKSGGSAPSAVPAATPAAAAPLVDEVGVYFKN